MATNFNETTPTSFNVDNCFKKKKYTFVCLSSDEINEEVAIGDKSVPVLEAAAVTQKLQAPLRLMFLLIQEYYT